jgi:hypothetical protein
MCVNACLGMLRVVLVLVITVALLGISVRKSTAQASTSSAYLIPERVWDRLAQCESRGNWNSKTGTFDGGLQFHPKTWRAYGGTAYAPSADQATREHQIAIAERVLARQGWRAWPACSRKLGLR